MLSEPLKLDPFQIDGTAYLATNRRALLADDTGLGKSAQLIRAADGLPAARILILCPAIGRVSWEIELEKWQAIPRQVLVYDAPGVPTRADSLPGGPLAVVMSYDWLAYKLKNGRARGRVLADHVRDLGFDLLILDEVHYVRNHKAARTKAVFGTYRASGAETFAGLAGALPVVWAASATPTLKDASELYPMLRSMFPGVLDAVLPPGHGNGYKTFRDHFCDVTQTTYDDKIVGNKRDRIPALLAAFEPHYIRRRKEDVMSQLGAIAYRDLPVDVHAPGVHVEAELDAVVNGVLALQPDDVAAMNMLRDLLARHEEAFATRRHALGVLKVVPVAAWVDDFLEAHPDEKVLLFAHHKEVLRRYESALKQYLPAVITGETSTDRRAAEVNRFQNEPQARVFIGQNVAASTSITLTAGSTVVMAEPDYTPNVNYQAISRAHRIGQLRPVIAYFAFAAGTMDQSLTRILRRRTADFAQMFDKINDQP